MTYVELVNEVLTRLREDTVTSVTENDYSALIGKFVNDAKRVVEDAWSWSQLIRTASIAYTQGATTFYDLEDYEPDPDDGQFNERARIYRDPQSGRPVVYVSTDDKEREVSIVPTTHYKARRLADANNSSQGTVQSIIVSTNPSAASGKSKLRFYLDQIPDANETLLIYLVNPQNALSSNAEVLIAPSDPVVQLAYLYCLYERGEELGEMLNLTASKAEMALADAIMHDSSMTTDVVLSSE
jgi:hypothetical protein